MPTSSSADVQGLASTLAIFKTDNININFNIHIKTSILMHYTYHQVFIKNLQFIFLMSDFYGLTTYRNLTLLLEDSCIEIRILRSALVILLDGIFMKFFLNQCRVWGGSNE